MIFDWNLRSRKHRTNADLIGAISPKKPFSSIMRYIVLWRQLWRYRINTNMKTWYPQKPHILTFTLIPSSFFSDHSVKLYRWMCITCQMPLVIYKKAQHESMTLSLRQSWCSIILHSFIKHIMSWNYLKFKEISWAQFNCWFKPFPSYNFSVSNCVFLRGNEPVILKYVLSAGPRPPPPSTVYWHYVEIE